MFEEQRIMLGAGFTETEVKDVWAISGDKAPKPYVHVTVETN